MIVIFFTIWKMYGELYWMNEATYPKPLFPEGSFVQEGSLRVKKKPYKINY
jgi:hypothetical protein